ncbi:MAG: glycerol-3-phosphate 1-O-acyltransferase PlsY [Clostridia bacterium]|nr:glycerol-3-phosphate 1-O-acyltransferase PlsY [Clostridia bacterium]
MIILAIFTVCAAYLIGSISFAVIFTKYFSKKDIRDFGSKNAGATNATRVGGKKVGALTFLCDCLKGTVAALIGRFVFAYIFAKTGLAWAMPIYGAYACGVACMLGHVFPCFFEFRGGKGVATGAGVFFAICPLAGGIGLATFILMIMLTRIVSVSSLCGTFATVLTAIICYDTDALFLPQMIYAVLMAAIIFVKHTENIKRLFSGEEKKISFGGKKNG